MDDIVRLQTDDEFRYNEGNKYCLVSIQGHELLDKDLNNQVNFCILQVINAYKDKKINQYDANRILNKIDALIYAKDMLGINRVIEKLNKEIVEEELHIPHFNSLCVLCGDLYNSI